jgi:hypothetical protein
LQTSTPTLSRSALGREPDISSPLDPSADTH